MDSLYTLIFLISSHANSVLRDGRYVLYDFIFDQQTTDN